MEQVRALGGWKQPDSHFQFGPFWGKHYYFLSASLGLTIILKDSFTPWLSQQLEKQAIQDDLREWFIKILQSNTKNWGNSPGNSGPRYLCLKYLSIMVTRYSFPLGYRDDWSPPPLSEWTQRPLNWPQESRYWKAIGHFKMAAVNIHWGIKIDLLSFPFFFLIAVRTLSMRSTLLKHF